MRMLPIVVMCGLAAPVYAQNTMSANPLSASLQTAWKSAAKNIRESADQMPEDGYAFKPVDGVRTFGQILAHVAGVNYVFCGAARADTTKRSEDDVEKSAKSKAEIVKALGDSLAYCDAVFAGLTDKTAADMLDLPFDMGKGTRAMPLLINVGHVNEHYGNLVTYFRIKGMVPPSSKGQ